MLYCPKCNTQISNENMNIQTDLAQCTHCSHIFKISSKINTTASVTSVNIQQPPAGAWYKNDHQTICLGATTRSYVALFLIPFMLYWSKGVLSWGTVTDTTEMTFSLALLPFVLIGGLFWCTALMSVVGKVEIEMNRQGGKIFVGVWKIGIYKTFEWQDIDFIQEEDTVFLQYPGHQGSHIVMEGKKRYHFGSGLKQERRYYVTQVLKHFHAQYRSKS